MRVSVMAALLGLTISCGGQSTRTSVASSGSCPDAGYFYRDTRCDGPLGDGGAGVCSQVGDGSCFDLCTSNAQCGGAAPYCRTLGLFYGGDFSCNSSVLVCRATDHNDLPGEPVN